MCSILIMRTSVILALLTSLFVHAADACSFPSTLQGTWTSSNNGTYTIGSSYLHMTKSIIARSTGTNFSCILNSGNLYIVQSMQAFVPFTGATTYFRAYICFDMNAVTSYSYYYYQQSDKETGFSNERIVGLANGTTVTPTSQVCKTTVDVSEYHTLVKSGAGYSSLVTCPDVMLGNHNYMYTDNTGSYCTSTTLMDVCSNKSVITFNYTSCSQRIAYSASGIIGCIITLSSGSTTYLTTYNFDTSVDGSTTYRFTCWAMAYSRSNVIASIKSNECENQQSPTTLPTGGAIVTMTPYYTCVPTTTSTTSATETVRTSTTSATETVRTPIIVGLVVGFIVLIIIIILVIYLYCCWWPPRRKKKLIGEMHLLEIGKEGNLHPSRKTSNRMAKADPVRRGGQTVAVLSVISSEDAILSSRSNAQFKSANRTTHVRETGGETTRSVTSVALNMKAKGNARKAPDSKFTGRKTSIGPMMVRQFNEAEEIDDEDESPVSGLKRTNSSSINATVMTKSQ